MHGKHLTIYTVLRRFGVRAGDALHILEVSLEPRFFHNRWKLNTTAEGKNETSHSNLYQR